jgi:hypothetical protein
MIVKLQGTHGKKKSHSLMRNGYLLRSTKLETPFCLRKFLVVRRLMGRKILRPYTGDGKYIIAILLLMIGIALRVRSSAVV